MPEGTTTERWAPIAGYEGIYSISDHGRVMSVPRVIVNKLGRTQRVPGGVMQPDVQWGYERVTLAEKKHFVHVLVAEAFVGPRPDGLECCHVDGNRRNNVPGNLEWDTHSRNMQDRRKHGTYPKCPVVQCPRGHSLLDRRNVYCRGPLGLNLTCRACDLASARLSYDRSLGVLPRGSLKDLSDWYYQRIVSDYRRPPNPVVEWMRSYMADGRTVPSQDALSACATMGFSTQSLKTARAKLGIVTVRVGRPGGGYQWYWTWPEAARAGAMTAADT